MLVPGRFVRIAADVDGSAVLAQPWPPPAPGPRQPRDAHGSVWANDVGRALVRRAGPPFPTVDAVAPAGWPTADPATRRRRGQGQRGERDPWVSDGPEPDAPARARPLPARWLPQEEWIPDPAPAPEQRWTPEQDWLGLFAAQAGPRPADEHALPPPPRGRGWLVAVAAVLPLALVAALVAALA
ncbi:hypothetical protein J1G44_08345 [Cellulomonas sp. zg-ZUI199]|uniref:Uncharacterized protein n=1 Tax=Cellulomonas wangleii TaxID=2816956 RepID=A0ABX8D4U4_9CELL|nr:hypothetical protein [Cellulomonas wangleii]MBO0924492.1 hypothetical protein [Cellulomonas wangleii]QVI62482.1 hypothetical protein KG103_00525 [Cellulomonas wangleii]